MSDDRQYVIWSHEHGMWWGPDQCGYTPDLSLAGLYTSREAGEIVVDVIPPGTEVAMHQTVAEKNGHRRSPGYDATHDWARKLAERRA